MKITRSVRVIYDRQLEINRLLADRVKLRLEGAKQEGWFYRGRIKPLESFAQKLETGRPDDPAHLEDFFACTLVVENRNAIGDARALVERFCEVRYQRPRDPDLTHKGPESFPFDDLRLYVTLRPMGPDEPITDIVFEVQIKTFLQYAWGIATRDLIYKGDQISWGRERVAYQIKAMLEHAEVSIAEVDAIADNGALNISNPSTQNRNRILEWLQTSWDSAQLPQDRRRLVETLLELAEGLKLSIDGVIDAVETATARGEGTNLRNLSPYGIVVRSLFQHRRPAVDTFLRERRVRGRTRLLLTEEMDLGALPTDARPERYHLLGGDDREAVLGEGDHLEPAED